MECGWHGKRFDVKKIVKLIILTSLLLAPACNYPGPPSRTPYDLSAQELRQTLVAQPNSTGGLAPPTNPAPEGAADPFNNLNTATPGIAQPAITQAPNPATGAPFFAYTTQSGDTLARLAARFEVDPNQIRADAPLPQEGLLPAGLLLNIPNTIGDTPYPSAIFPDSEVVYSPSSVGFDIQAFIRDAGGYLSHYEENVDGVPYSGAQIIQRVAAETSTNPRVLLSFLEFRSHWVYGQPASADQVRYPIGFYVAGYQGLYKELALTGKLLNMGFYGWRLGNLSELPFRDQSRARISPELNAGSVAVQYLFARTYDQEPWVQALFGSENFPELHREMFADPWARAQTVEPLFPQDLTQPPLELPFQVGERWSFTGGPHLSWNTGTPWGGLDFAPVTGEAPCRISRAWATAIAGGVIVRSENSVVSLDLDGDGYEQTGWVVIYLHLAEKDRIPAGAIVQVDQPLGHPSCEGGRTTGTHVHIARKYNGVWVPAGEPLPFTLSGWRVHSGEKIYQGYLEKDGQIVSANPGGSSTSIIVR
jgi:LasA protease